MWLFVTPCLTLFFPFSKFLLLSSLSKFNVMRPKIFIVLYHWGLAIEHLMWQLLWNRLYGASVSSINWSDYLCINNIRRYTINWPDNGLQCFGFKVFSMYRQCNIAIYYHSPPWCINLVIMQYIYSPSESFQLCVWEL